MISNLKFICKIAFSSLYDVICPFTRDFELVRSKLNNLEDYDKTCLKIALQGVNTLVLEEWGNSTLCQVQKPFFSSNKNKFKCNDS